MDLYISWCILIRFFNLLTASINIIIIPRNNFFMLPPLQESSSLVQQQRSGHHLHHFLANFATQTSLETHISTTLHLHTGFIVDLFFEGVGASQKALPHIKSLLPPGDLRRVPSRVCLLKISPKPILLQTEPFFLREIINMAIFHGTSPISPTFAASWTLTVST